MNRLHLPPSELKGDTATVRGDALGYLRDVLRLRPGAPIEVFDGEGHVYASSLTGYVDDGAELSLGAREDRPFTGVRVTLFQGLPKGDKFELIVQKAVELGATSIVPVATERAIVKLDERKAADRIVRWQKIADEAARQSKRADRLLIEPVLSFDALVSRAVKAGEKRLVLDEEETRMRLRDQLTDSVASYGVLIGPEGGLTRDEVRLAKMAGFVPVTLGARILRTETAGLAVLTAIQYALGDFG